MSRLLVAPELGLSPQWETGNCLSANDGTHQSISFSAGRVRTLLSTSVGGTIVARLPALGNVARCHCSMRGLGVNLKYLGWVPMAMLVTKPGDAFFVPVAIIGYFPLHAVMFYSTVGLF